MDRYIKLALLGLIAVSVMGVAFIDSFAYDLYFGRMPPARLAIAMMGWAMASYGPVVSAALLWKLTKRSSAPWVLHMLLLPIFYGLLVAGNALMLSTLSVPDFDDTLGAPMMPAFSIVIVTAAIYLLAAIARSFTKSKTPIYRN